MPPGATIEIDDLRFAYGDQTPALDGISLSIPAGERFGIIGPSGAGKSTLLLHLNGLLRGQGTIKIDGTTLADGTLGEIRRKMGLVFQNPDDQLFHPTVEEDVAFGPLNLGLTRDEARARVSAVLGALRLAGFEKKSPHHLSFGERKRVALATVLAMQPAAVALDEPFSNLDPQMVHDLVELVRGLPGTVVLVSQLILPAMVTCDRLAVVDRGRIVACGPSREIVRDRALLRASGLDFSFYCDACRELERG